MKNKILIEEESNLSQIIGVQFLQNIQDFFANTMDVAIICIENNSPISSPSNFRDFCINCVEKNELTKKLCNNCVDKMAQQLEEDKKPIIYHCPTGLTNFAIPLFFKKQHVGNLIGGQILLYEPDIKEFKKLAKALGLEEQEYIRKIKNIKVIPREKFEIMVDSLALIANSLIAIAYANSQLSELNLDYKLPKNISLEELISLSASLPEKTLTSREYEVLKLIVLGKSNTEIAKELFISVHTAKAHVSSIIEKLKVQDRVQMAVKAVRKGLI